MAVTLPIVNGSTGTWGTILNDAITDIDGRLVTATNTNGTQKTDIEALDLRLDTIEATNTIGLLAVSTAAGKPAARVGLMGLETDTGYMYYCASIAGVATRVPFPGQFLAKIKQTSAQNFTSGNGAALILHSADTNRTNGWTSGTRFTATVPGMYEFTGAIAYGANAAGYRSAIWYKGGNPINGGGATISATPITPTSAQTIVVARPCIIGLNVGDYMELWGAQNSGVTLATDTSLAAQSGIQVKYLGYYA